MAADLRGARQSNMQMLDISHAFSYHSIRRGEFRQFPDDFIARLTHDINILLSSMTFSQTIE